MRTIPIPPTSALGVYGNFIKDNQPFLGEFSTTSNRRRRKQPAEDRDLLRRLYGRAAVNRLGAKRCSRNFDQIAAMQIDEGSARALARLHTSLRTNGLSLTSFQPRTSRIRRM